MKTHFINARNALKKTLAELVVTVEATVYDAIKAVENCDIKNANKLIENDSIIDEEEVRIEEECLKILALYQPVASDLREIITILKINNELERVGDLSVNIANRVEDFAKYKNSEIEKIDFQEMLFRVCEMLKSALDSLSYRDDILAAKILKEDDVVDLLHKKNYAKVRELILKYPDSAQYYMCCLTVSRSLERIADTATNIAEDVIYLERGRIVRHHHL